MSRTIDITAVSKLKHAELWKACQKLGGQAALAKHLNVNPSRLGEWVNLKTVPSRNSPRFAELDAKLAMVCDGKGMDDLFPDELRNAVEFLKANKTVQSTVSIEYDALLHYAEATRERLSYQPPMQETFDMREDLEQAMRHLTERQKLVIAMRFGLKDGIFHTYEEVGDAIHVTRERARQIELRALRSLENTDFAKRKDWIEGKRCSKCRIWFANKHACDLHEQDCQTSGRGA